MKTLLSDPVRRYAELYPEYALKLRQLGVNGLTLREQALRRLEADGFAVAGREEWKYGDISPAAEGGFTPRPGLVRPAGEPSLPPAVEGGLRLVFVNGRFQADLSASLKTLPPGVTIAPLAEAGNAPALGSVAEIAHAPLTALNTAFWQDGLLLRLDEGASLKRPVELVFMTDRGAEGALVAPRNLILAGRGSRALVLERHVGRPGVRVLNAAVTEVVCGPEARIEHLKWLEDGPEALHYGSTHVIQETGSNYASREFLLGGERARRETHVRLAGEGASCTLTGLSLADDGRHADVRTRVHHETPGCTTDELYKGLFQGSGRGVFDGLIKVARDAQQTRAYQTNRNLLLGDDAVSHSIPRLEIYADDVKCSHGSTTGQLSDDQLFYLRSRGFAEAEARSLLSFAFASEVVDAVPLPDLRRELTAAVHRRLEEGGR